MDDILLIAGLGDPTIADFASFAARGGSRKVVVVSTDDVCRRVEAPAEAHPIEHCSRETLSGTCKGGSVSGVVLFLGVGPTPAAETALDAVIAVAEEAGVERVCVVSTDRVHFNDRRAAAEARLHNRVKGSAARTVLFRPAHVLSRNSRGSAWLRALWFCYPLVPKRFQSCCVEGDELFAAIEQELAGPPTRRGATCTIL